MTHWAVLSAVPGLSDTQLLSKRRAVGDKGRNVDILIQTQLTTPGTPLGNCGLDATELFPARIPVRPCFLVVDLAASDSTWSDECADTESQHAERCQSHGHLNKPMFGPCNLAHFYELLGKNGQDR